MQNEFPLMQHVTVFLNFIIRIYEKLSKSSVQSHCTHFTCVFNQSSFYSVAGCQEVCAMILIQNQQKHDRYINAEQHLILTLCN